MKRQTQLALVVLGSSGIGLVLTGIRIGTMLTGSDRGPGTKAVQTPVPQPPSLPPAEATVRAASISQTGWSPSPESLPRGAVDSRPSRTPVERDLLPPAETTRVLTTEEIVTRSEKSVALVRGRRGAGTGFLIRPGILVTNAHVIEGEPLEAIKITFPSAPRRDRGPLPGSLLHEDTHRDLAFLSVESALPSLEVDSGYQFRRGQEITIIGNPGTEAGAILENAVSRGVMSTRMRYQGQDFYQMSVAINGGNSGGPVIGSEGKVLGVATLKDSSREQLAFCIPADALARAIARVEAQSAEPDRTAASLHDHQSIMVRLDALGQFYEKALSIYAAEMDRAASHGISPNYGRSRAQRALQDHMTKAYQVTSEDLYPELCRAVADPHLPQQVRKDLSSLWTNCLVLKGQAERPSGASRVLRLKARELLNEHARLAKGLRRAFGLE